MDEKCININLSDWWFMNKGIEVIIEQKYMCFDPHTHTHTQYLIKEKWKKDVAKMNNDLTELKVFHT